MEANYANMERILEELEYAEKLCAKWVVNFDVSNKAVEEVANKILQVVRRSSRMQKKECIFV